MNPFEYLTVLYSIIVAIGVTQIIFAWRDMIRHRNQIEPYWLHTLWMGFGLLILIQMWWGDWELHLLPNWDYFSFLLVLSAPITLTLALSILAPALDGSTDRDLRVYYFHHHHWAFGFAALYMIESVIGAVALRGEPLLGERSIMRLVGVVLLTTLAVSGRERVHVGVLATTFVLHGLFVLTQYTMSL